MNPEAPVATFANHRGVVPALSVFAVLAVCELFGVHLLVAIKWPIIAWVLSAITLASIVWLTFWIRSWKRRPHQLFDETLRLHFGSLRHIDLALANVADWREPVSAAVLAEPDTVNFVPVAWPNRIILLREPLANRRRTRRVAIRLDDPTAFDAALADQCMAWRNPSCPQGGVDKFRIATVAL